MTALKSVWDAATPLLIGGCFCCPQPPLDIPLHTSASKTWVRTLHMLPLTTVLPPEAADTLDEGLGGKGTGQGGSVWAPLHPQPCLLSTLPDSFAHLLFPWDSPSSPAPLVVFNPSVKSVMSQPQLQKSLAPFPRALGPHAMHRPWLRVPGHPEGLCGSRRAPCLSGQPGGNPL